MRLDHLLSKEQTDEKSEKFRSDTREALFDFEDTEEELGV